ncbi:TetR-like C-terminal domain-containing protein [Mycolicibacterium vaccae]|uniref:TetR-like C-terminal domain-containing protein n=1 Tax=Mycolicibacterium vaccae TaxID=1810 RepID=UPI003D077350
MVDRAGVRGLRRDVTDGIIEAVLDELAAVGYGKLSMDGVARRAKAGKAALYRRWPSKQDMVLDAVATISVPAGPGVSSGDLRADLAELVHGVDDWVSDPRMARVLPDLLAEATRNPGLAAALTERIGVTRREAGQAVIDAAIARGEVDPDVDIEYALDLVAAPVFWRICGRRLHTTPEFLDRVVDTVLHALRD